MRRWVSRGLRPCTITHGPINLNTNTLYFRNLVSSRPWVVRKVVFILTTHASPVPLLLHTAAYNDKSAGRGDRLTFNSDCLYQFPKSNVFSRAGAPAISKISRENQTEQIS